MKLFPNAKALFALLLGMVIVAGLSACGGAGGEADTIAPEVKLAPLGVVSNLERTRALSGTMELGASVTVTADTAANIGEVKEIAGTWSCSVDLVRGANTISVKATDSTGNNQTLVFVLTYEVVTLDPLLVATPLTAQTISGTLAAGATLSGTVNGVALSVDTRSIVGTEWTWTLPAPGSGVESLNLELVGTDSASPLQLTTLTPTLVVDSTLPVVNVDRVAPVTVDSVTIGGTVDDISTLSLTAPEGVIVGEVTAGATAGSWACSLSGLVPGRNQIDILSKVGDKTGTARLVVLYIPAVN